MNKEIRNRVNHLRSGNVLWYMASKVYIHNGKVVINDRAFTGKDEEIPVSVYQLKKVLTIPQSPISGIH